MSIKEAFSNKNSTLRRSFGKEKITKKLLLIFELILLIGLSFIILYPFLIKLSAAFMSVEDTYDDTVSLIPRHPTFDNIKYIFTELPMMKALIGTLVLSLVVAVLTTVTATLVGYGLAKFRFYGKRIIIFFVLFSLLIPFSTIIVPTYMYFRYFDMFGILSLITGSSISTINTAFPVGFLAATGLGFRGGLYILIMYQAFKGLPQELDEAGMVDGAGIARTFIEINIPLVKSMMLVVFVISFAWQWTDKNYSDLLFSNTNLFPQILTQISTHAETSLGNGTYVQSLISNGALLIMIMPLLILYCFVQRQLVQGIERTGLVG